MKMFKIFMVTAGTLLLTNSCQKFVQVDLPKSQLVRETVFKDYSTANAAMVQIYSLLRDRLVLSNTGISDLTKICGMYGDELKLWSVFSGTNNSNDLVYLNNLIPSHPYVGYVWDNSYFIIYSANAIIEGLARQADSNISTADQDRLTGEALFIRSFVHFYLTNLYGNIPYVTHTDYVSNNKLSRLSKDEVLKNLEDDLKKAIALLPEAYTDVERVRPNASAARALLARVYLYHEKWQEAVDTANDVLENSAFEIVQDLGAVFLKDSRETIWQLSPNTSTGITPEAGSYILVSAPPSLLSLSDQMVSAFDLVDQRRAHWVGKIADANGTEYYYAYKYKRRLSTTPQNEYSIQIRLAELYLIRAEARAQLHDFDGSTADLNRIRVRAGLVHISSSNKEEILTSILEERNRELFLEYPHRFFDLIRTGNTHILAARKSGWDANDVLWPIPESEILVNPNLLPQNPGY